MQDTLYLADTYNQLFILQFVAIYLLEHPLPCKSCLAPGLISSVDLTLNYG